VLTQLVADRDVVEIKLPDNPKRYGTLAGTRCAQDHAPEDRGRGCGRIYSDRYHGSYGTRDNAASV